MDKMEEALYEALERLKSARARISDLENEIGALREELEHREPVEYVSTDDKQLLDWALALANFADCQQPGYFNDTWSESAKTAIRDALWEAMIDRAREAFEHTSDRWHDGFYPSFPSPFGARRRECGRRTRTP